MPYIENKLIKLLFSLFLGFVGVCIVSGFPLEPLVPIIEDPIFYIVFIAIAILTWKRASEKPEKISEKDTGKPPK